MKLTTPEQNPIGQKEKGKKKTDQPPPLSFRAPKSEYSLLLGVVKGKIGSEGREKVAEQHKKTSLLFGSERRDIVKREVRVHWGARREGRRAALGDPFEQEGATVQPGKERGTCAGA